MGIGLDREPQPLLKIPMVLPRAHLEWGPGLGEENIMKIKQLVLNSNQLAS